MFAKLKHYFGLTHDSKSAFRKATVAERQAAQSGKTADEFRGIGRALLLAGVIGSIAQVFAPAAGADALSHSLTVAFIGVVTWSIGIVLTGRYVPSEKGNVASEAYVPGSSALKRTAKRGRQQRR